MDLVWFVAVHDPGVIAAFAQKNTMGRPCPSMPVGSGSMMKSRGVEKALGSLVRIAWTWHRECGDGYGGRLSLRPL